jgi:hypothetical protein
MFISSYACDAEWAHIVHDRAAATGRNRRQPDAREGIDSKN